MKTTILNQRAERDELMSRPYQQRHTKYDAEELLQNPIIKLITGLVVLANRFSPCLCFKAKISLISILMTANCLKSGMRIW